MQIIDVIILDIKDNNIETKISSLPLLWYLLDITSSENSKVLKKKSIIKDKINWKIKIILTFSSPKIILIKSNFLIITERKIWKAFLLSLIKAKEKGNSLISSFSLISLLLFIEYLFCEKITTSRLFIRFIEDDDDFVFNNIIGFDLDLFLVKIFFFIFFFLYFDNCFFISFFTFSSLGIDLYINLIILGIPQK